MITKDLNMNECTVQQIDTQDLIMRKVCAKMVPKKLNHYQKTGQYEASAEMIERLETEADFLTRLMTCDESWVFEYDPDTKGGTR
jgi:hypothetical protein